MKKDDQRSHSVPSTARILDVSERTVWRMIWEDELESVKLRGRRVVPDAAIDRLLEAGTGTSRAESGGNDRAHSTR